MIFLKDLLILICIGAFVGAVGTVTFDIFLALELDRILRRGEGNREAFVGNAALRFANGPGNRNGPLSAVRPGSAPGN